MARSGHRVLQGSEATVHLSGGWCQREGSHSGSRHARRARNFGDGGRQPASSYAVHSIATDSKGNVFTTETYRGQRIQKFVFKGLGPGDQEGTGVLWPKSAKSPTRNRSLIHVYRSAVGRHSASWAILF